MKIRIKQLLLPALIVLGLAGALMPVTPASAIDVYQPCENSSDKTITTNSICAGTGDSSNTLLKTIVNTLLFIIGGLAVIMIIIGGIRYVLSAGNPQAAAGAKSTILYAVIGLVVAFLAYAIINWVIGALQGKASTS